MIHNNSLNQNLFLSFNFFKIFYFTPLMSQEPMDIDHELTWQRKRKEKEDFKYLYNCNYNQIMPYVPPKKTDQKITIKKEIKKQNTRKILYYFKETVRFMINLPNYLLHYANTIFNTILLLIFSYILISSILLLRKDIKDKIKIQKKAIEILIKKSTYNYHINKCEPNQRVPALQNLCSKWECDMNRSIDSVQVLKIIAEVIGDFIDTFVGKISYRSIIFGAIILVSYLIIRKRG